MPWNRWMRNLEPVNTSNIHWIVPVNICVMSATAGWRQTNRRIRRGRRRYRNTASSLSALSHALSLPRSLLLYPSLLTSSSINKKTAMAGEFELCLVLFLFLCFFCFPLLLLWFCIGCESGFSVENNRSRYACTNLCTLFMFFSCGLSCPVSVCGFGLVFFFVRMGKHFVLELLCERVSFPSEARHMTAACIRSSRADVLGLFLVEVEFM